MTINKNSWHYKLCVEVIWSMNGNYPEKTNLCRYFWTVVGSLFTVIIGVSLIVPLLVLYAVIVILILGLSCLLGFKIENDEIALRHWSIHGFKVYPFYIWMTLAIGGVLAWLSSQPAPFVWHILALLALGAIVLPVFGMAIVIVVALLGSSIEQFENWNANRRYKARCEKYVEPIKNPGPRRENELGMWSVTKAYLKAWKGKFCPIVTFDDKPTNLEM